MRERRDRRDSREAEKSERVWEIRRVRVSHARNWPKSEEKAEVARKEVG